MCVWRHAYQLPVHWSTIWLLRRKMAPPKSALCEWSGKRSRADRTFFWAPMVSRNIPLSRAMCSVGRQLCIGCSYRQKSIVLYILFIYFVIYSFIYFSVEAVSVECLNRHLWNFCVKSGVTIAMASGVSAVWVLSLRCCIIAMRSVHFDCSRMGGWNCKHCVSFIWTSNTEISVKCNFFVSSNEL